MKKITISIIAVVIITFVSCEGKFEPINPVSNLSATELQFPINNEVCFEGQFLETGKIEVPFVWTKIEEAINYRIEVTDQGSQTKELVETAETFANVALEPGTLYVWEVFSIKDNEEKKSESWSFYSQGFAQINFVPFPAVLTISENANSTVDLSWESTDVDFNISGYDVYFSTEDPPSLLLEGVTSTSRQDVPVISGMTYHFKVVTKDASANSSTSKMSFIVP